MIRPASLFLSLTLSMSVAGAWSPTTRARQIDDAVRLMPAGLRLALERHRESLLRGAIEPLIEPPASDIEQLARELTATLTEPRPFPEAARAFGRLAYAIANAGFPPLATPPVDPARLDHFAAFCESRRDRFPLVFYGHDAPDLARGDWPAFARAILARSAGEDVDLARAYAAAAVDPDPTGAFDDRSVPFAIGSLAYSHTVTDIVRGWLGAWSTAGGDLSRTPYLRPDLRRTMTKEAPR